MTTEYIISEELANKVCAILVNYGENSFANKLCSRPAPASAPIAPTEDNELEELGNQDIDPAVFEAYANACNKGAEEQYFKEYAATIRNETLEIFMTAIENRFDDTNQGRGVVGTIRSIKESVRQGEQE